MLALLYVSLCALLAMLIGVGVILTAARSQGISTVPWTSSEGVGSFLNHLGNGLLGIAGVGLLGMLIAVLTRSAAAVGISLVCVHVGETLIAMVWPDGAQWLPVHIFSYLPGVSSPMSSGIYRVPAPGCQRIAGTTGSAERTKAVIDLPHRSTEEGRLARGEAQTRLGIEA
jgi:hypothetical protein